ncbi:MAG: hypothetical protein DHS20C18_36420 [Saprospiraceae bacterium]|nr:MAG: hypothetical protein DHS20C18_36420 [Saprospiraceae bacterium]
MNQEIEKTLIQYRSFLLAEAYLNKLKGQIYREKKTLNEIIQATEASEHEIINFEQAGVLEKLLNKDKASFEVEKERYYKLVINYKKSKKTIELSEFEVKVLEEKVKSGPALKEKLHQLLKERKDTLEESNLNNIDVILELTERIDSRIGLRTELEEAIEVGKTLLKNIDEANDYLIVIKQDMISRGKFDSLVGASIIKLEKLQGLVILCEKRLMEYKNEISDLYEYIKLKGVPKFKDGNEFVDEYFEALSSDQLLSLSWQTGSDYLMTIANKIDSTQKALKKDLYQIMEQKREMEEKRDVLIKGSV